MKTSAAGHPSVRPLACAVMLAMGVLPLGDVTARQLDGEQAEVVAGETPETWSLRNGARLLVTGGHTYDIDVTEGSVDLTGATVTRLVSGNKSVTLRGTSALRADGTLFQGGGLWLTNDSTAHLTDSSIQVQGVTGALASVGVDFLGLGGDSAHATLDNTRVTVADNPGTPDYNSGLGVRMAAGSSIDIINGSYIDAANIGVHFWGTDAAAGTTRLRVDGSTVRSGRGAALHIGAVSAVDKAYDILIANDARLIGGDGHLLRVTSLLGDPTASVSTVAFTVDDSRLRGDVTFDTRTVTGTLDVTLRNNARIDGRFINVSRADIGTNSTWML
ncbi:MAG: autotransporter outer membrane beta-barrel domain-containing protein, partial [Stenotrophomonas sp.]|nr:autotransporter outer membrane beta-barrel domain-containing protein [Stenotrophomonas sp.]